MHEQKKQNKTISWLGSLPTTSDMTLFLVSYNDHYAYWQLRWSDGPAYHSTLWSDGLIRARAHMGAAHMGPAQMGPAHMGPGPYGSRAHLGMASTVRKFQISTTTLL